MTSWFSSVYLLLRDKTCGLILTYDSRVRMTSLTKTQKVYYYAISLLLVWHIINFFSFSLHFCGFMTTLIAPRVPIFSFPFSPLSFCQQQHYGRGVVLQLLILWALKNKSTKRDDKTVRAHFAETTISKCTLLWWLYYINQRDPLTYCSASAFIPATLLHYLLAFSQSISKKRKQVDKKKNTKHVSACGQSHQIKMFGDMWTYI